MVYKVITLIIILPNKMKIIKQNSWRRISQSEIRNSAAESEDGQKFLPPQPPSFLPVRAWKPRRTARMLGGRNRAEFPLSLFEFFSGGARKRKIVRENFCEVAAEALAEAGGGAVSSVQKMFEQSCIIPP